MFIQSIFTDLIIGFIVIKLLLLLLIIIIILSESRGLDELHSIAVVVVVGGVVAASVVVTIKMGEQRGFPCGFSDLPPERHIARGALMDRWGPCNVLVQLARVRVPHLLWLGSKVWEVPLDMALDFYLLVPISGVAPVGSIPPIIYPSSTYVEAWDMSMDLGGGNNFPRICFPQGGGGRRRFPEGVHPLPMPSTGCSPRN